MKNQWNKILVVWLSLILGFANGCAGTDSQPAPTQTAPAIPTPTSPADDPAAVVVLDMVKHLNDGDFEGSLSYFADDARVYFVGMPPTGMDIYQGMQALRAVWEDCANNHFKWEVEITSSAGGIVTAQTKTWHDFTRQLGVAPNEFEDVYVVEDGKITAYTSVLTEDSLAKFKPALAAVMPTAEAATPSAEDPAESLTLTLLDGTCSYNGPLILKAGDIELTWAVKDNNRQLYGLTIFTLDPGKDGVDLMAASMNPTPPAWSKLFFYKEQAPDTTKTYTFTAEQGAIYLVCWSKPPDVPVGIIGPFEVRP